MDRRDREHIKNFVDVLIEKTDFKKVYTLLLRWQVIPVHLQAFKKLSKSDKENNKVLYSVIQSRGREAFSKLKQALQLSNPELSDQFEGRPWRISDEQWVCSPQVYSNSDAKVRGSFCVVVMTGNRRGWNEEVKKLTTTFENLRYEGSTFQDPSNKELDNLIINFTENTSDAGCYVFALLGHGNVSKGEECILLANKSYMRVNEILYRICKAPRLLNKPKIIILQMCRGDREVMLHMLLKTTPPTTQVEIPDIKDTIILRPCLPGYVAYRDISSGGWFIDILTDKIQKHAREKCVEEIMIEVQQELTRMKETETGFFEDEGWRYMAPCANAYSFKKFYFLPKEESSDEKNNNPI